MTLYDTIASVVASTASTTVTGFDTVKRLLTPGKRARPASYPPASSSAAASGAEPTPKRVHRDHSGPASILRGGSDGGDDGAWMGERRASALPEDIGSARGGGLSARPGGESGVFAGMENGSLLAAREFASNSAAREYSGSAAREYGGSAVRPPRSSVFAPPVPRASHMFYSPSRSLLGDSFRPAAGRRQSVGGGSSFLDASARKSSRGQYRKNSHNRRLSFSETPRGGGGKGDGFGKLGAAKETPFVRRRSFGGSGNSAAVAADGRLKSVSGGAGAGAGLGGGRTRGNQSVVVFPSGPVSAVGGGPSRGGAGGACSSGARAERPPRQTEMHRLRTEEQSKMRAEARGFNSRLKLAESRAAPVFAPEPRSEAGGRADGEEFHGGDSGVESEVQEIKSSLPSSAPVRRMRELRRQAAKPAVGSKKSLISSFQRSEFSEFVANLITTPQFQASMEDAGVNLPEMSAYDVRIKKRKEMMQKKQDALAKLRANSLIHQRKMDGDLDVDGYVNALYSSAMVTGKDAGPKVDEPGDDALYQFNYWSDDGEDWDSDLEREAAEEEKKGVTVQDETSAFAMLTRAALARVRRNMERGVHYEELAIINNVPIKGVDFVRLKPNEWLNDEIVNGFMGLILERAKRWEKALGEMPEGDPRRESTVPRVQVQNSFFYGRLFELDRATGKRKYNYASVRRWTKRYDVFSYDYMFVPINQSNTHWTLAVVNFRDKRIEYYDSMAGSGREVLDNLMHWVRDEMEHKKKSVLDESEWETISHGLNVPQQTNCDDCGMFLCMFADFLARGANINFSALHMNYFRARMAHELLVKRRA